MVDWKYVRVCIVVLVAQLMAINVSSVLFGLVVYFGVAIVSGMLAYEILINLLTLSEMPKVFKMFVLVLILFNIYVVLAILRWILVTMCALFAIQASIVILLEVVADEIIAYMHSFDESPTIGWKLNRWEMVAAVRSSNNGYASKQFQFILHDLIESNDYPFEPEHASFVHLVEIHRHNVVWKEIVVWRVSMLNGVQTPMARMHFVAIDAPFNRRFTRARVRCYESRGVVFALVQDAVRGKILFVCDTHNNAKCAQFKILDDIEIESFGSITCLRRLYNANDDQVKGWKIRLQTMGSRLDNQDMVLLHLAKHEMELREGVDGPANLNVSTMTIGRFDVAPQANHARTSDGMVGVWLDGDGCALLYDPMCNVHVYFADLDELSGFDKPFAAFIEHRGNGMLSGIHGLIVLNDRECILSSEDGCFARMEINPATALYTSAKRIFRADPSLKSKMNADEYRQLTGIARMDAHLES